MRKCSILFVAAEVAPFVSVGGLSQVLYFLPKALKKQGHDVRIFMPKYTSINEKKHKIKPLISNLRVPTGQERGIKEIMCNVKVCFGNRLDPMVYFLENMEYYERRANVYGYADDHIRFALLSRGVLEFLKQSEWKPKIVHCNDWHTGYVADFLRSHYRHDKKLQQLTSVFTIHNLRSQGMSDFRNASPLNFDDGKSKPASFFSADFKKQNPIKRGIIYSDLVNTVSDTYAREILTEEYGEGLNPLIKEVRTKVFGVLNGIDYASFDPTTDTIIHRNFSSTKLSDRVTNKLDLQKEFNLTVDPNIPLLAMVGRLDSQKGLDLVIEVLPYLLKEHKVQFIAMGAGEQKYHRFFTKMEREYPDQVGTHLMRDWKLPRTIFAGCDIFLLPSKFEPGGIVVIEAMRYGAVPVVRATGGLADTVYDFGFRTDKKLHRDVATGTGFTFHDFSSLAFYGAIIRALEIYKNKQLWYGIAKRAMRSDFSWEQSAKKYHSLYLRAIDYHKGKPLSPVVRAMRG